jgi:hypothetical protein
MKLVIRNASAGGRRARTSRALFIAAGVALLAATEAGPSLARAPLGHPHVSSWAISSTEAVGSSPSVVYNLAAPAADRSVLAEQIGKHWDALLTLKPTKAETVRVSGPALKAGRHYFRIEILNRRGQVLVASSPRPSTGTRTPPSVAWSLPGVDSVNANAATSFSWTSSQVPAAYSVVLQQAEGTGKVWQTLQTLTGSTGTGGLPAVGIGQGYPFRVAVLDNTGFAIATASTSVNAFGSVSFAVLDNDSSGNDAGTYTSPTSTFTWEFRLDEWYNQGGTIVTVPANLNDCESLSLQYEAGAGSGDWAQDTGTQTATLVQESANPVTSTAAFNKVGTLSSQIVPDQSWSVEVQYTGSHNDDDYYAYLNGTAVCDSTTPIFQN